MVVNMNMRGQREGNINQYLADTIAGAFSEIYTIDVPGTTNRELFASNSPKMLETMEKNTAKEKNGALLDLMRRISDGLQRYEAGNYRMTDDKAPVELLGMQVIDDLIAEEAAYYKGIYEEKGIQGLLEVLK